jgi:hypothetical protein
MRSRDEGGSPEKDARGAGEVEEVIDLSAPSPDGSEGAESLLELVLAEQEARASREEPLPARVDGVLIGRLIGFDGAGEPVVDFEGCSAEEGLKARAMAALTEADAGREVALLFEGGDPKKPVVMGLMFRPSAPRPAVVNRTPGQATVDGERLVFSAEREIVLQCGEASITLTKAGKVLIRGAYVLARSSGVNRIQGGSVQIN